MRNRIEARDYLHEAGISAPELVREMQALPGIVHGVLNGDIKGDYGQDHKVAVALSLKEGVIVLEAPIGELRIPTESPAIAALACIEPNRADGVRDARIDGKEAPRRKAGGAK